MTWFIISHREPALKWLNHGERVPLTFDASPGLWGCILIGSFYERHIEIPHLRDNICMKTPNIYSVINPLCAFAFASSQFLSSVTLLPISLLLICRESPQVFSLYQCYLGIAPRERLSVLVWYLLRHCFGKPNLHLPKKNPAAAWQTCSGS